MSSTKNGSCFVLKRFDRLAARNLLYYEQELACLQMKVDEMDAEDYRDVSDFEARQCVQDWESFQAMAQEPGRQQERWETHKKVRQTLHEYCEI
jgi:hypothetical protein